MSQQKRIFLICPVRDADESLKLALGRYVARLEARGFQVHYPAWDTKQDDPTGGYDLCRTNFRTMLDAEEIHIWYDESSNGSKFDMGGVFMMHMLGMRKNIVIANEDHILVDTQKKSFLRVMR